MICYIAGKITGDDRYYEKFCQYEESMEFEGYEVINPAKTSATLPESFQHEDYMDVCFMLIDKADMVAFMPDWKDSIGACMEYGYARGRRKEVRFFE